MVETAVILPVFFIMISGVLEFGHVYMVIHALNSATNKGTGGYPGHRIASAFVKSGHNTGPGSRNGERFDITVDRVKAHFGLTDLEFPNDAGNWNEDIKDGIADYKTTDRSKQYAFYQVKRAIDKGYTVHAITVGQGADHALLKAIAHAGGGVWMDVPGGSTIDQLEDEMRAAFAQIALHVPPPKLINAE